MKDNYSTLDALASVDAVVRERHKLLDVSDPCVVHALVLARSRIGSAVRMGEEYGVAGFVIQYHSQTRLAEQYMNKHKHER